MGIPSLKKDTIVSLASLCETEGLENNSLILLTAFGTISGKLAKTGEGVDESDPKIFLQYYIEENSKNYKEENSINGYCSGNDGCIVLKDVVLQSSTAKKFNFGNLVVFFDQIIGATFGNLSEDIN